MSRSTSLVTPVLVAGSLILIVNFAIRSSFGVFQIPIAEEFGWLRADFSMAIAIQNLAWGIGQPLFSAIAERFSDRKAIILGAITYAAGLVFSAYAVTAGQHQAIEVLVGFGIAGTGFGLVLAIIGRAASDENRSMALGIATAVGSVGQVIGPPLAAGLLTLMPWQMVFIVFAGLILSTLLLLPFLRSPEPADTAAVDETLRAILGKALRDPSYALIFVGFFSCGFQLAFITAHFPAFVAEASAPIAQDGVLAALGIGSTPVLGAVALGMIGLANIAGALIAGHLGKSWTRKYLLAWIYVGRTVAAAAFILLPMTPASVLTFSALMGLLWLATVPLTSGLIGHIYGLRYMGTLYGIVFLSHQLGGFLGVWLGGALYDIYGTYTVVWWVGVGVSAFSAIVHLPIRETPLSRRALAA